jgi:hypothetical protein
MCPHIYVSYYICVLIGGGHEATVRGVREVIEEAGLNADIVEIPVRLTVTAKWRGETIY